MPVLPNLKHEAFAQAIAKGMDQTKAYASVGLKPNRAHASRLAARGNIKARVRELQEKSAQAVINTNAYDALSMFDKLSRVIDRAIALDDPKTAGELQMKLIACFGYADSPTMTHEHVRQVKLSASEAEDGEKAEVKKAGHEFSKGLDALLKAQRKRSQT